MAYNGILNNLQKFFKLKIPKQVSELTDIKPGKIKETEKTKTIVTESFPSAIQLYLKEYYERIKSGYFHKNTFQFEKLVRDIDDMILGEPRMDTAVEYRSAEILQADSSSVALTINSKDKAQVAFIEQYNDKFKIPDKLRAVATDYSRYGNHVWVLSLSEKGISGISVVKAKDLKQRYEFSPSEINNFKSSNTALSNTQRMKIYLDSVSNLSEATYFEKYLLGYDVGPFLLPPWNVTHFRHKSENSLFSPFGEPPYLGSLTPYKNYDVIRGLRAALLAANLPREFIGITIENTPATEIMEKLTELAAAYENLGLRKPSKEGKGIAETVYYVKNAMEIEYVSPELKMPDEADLEFALDDIVVSTKLPRQLLESKDGFGDGSGSIVELSKYFYRLIYKDQTSILDTLAEHYKLAMILSGDFDLEEIDFTLSLPYPESMVNEDAISNQGNLIKLAADTIEFFQTNYANGGTLPPKAMQKIMYQILPFHSDWVEELVKLIDKGITDQSMPQDGLKENVKNKLFETYIEKSHELKENYFKQNSDFKKTGHALFTFMQNYYIDAGIKNNRRFNEFKGVKTISDTKIFDEVYARKRLMSGFKDEYFQGRHHVHSGFVNNLFLDNLNNFCKSDSGKQKFSEDYSKLKKVEKKRGKNNIN